VRNKQQTALLSCRYSVSSTGCLLLSSPRTALLFSTLHFYLPLRLLSSSLRCISISPSGCSPLLYKLPLIHNFSCTSSLASIEPEIGPCAFNHFGLVPFYRSLFSIQASLLGTHIHTHTHTHTQKTDMYTTNAFTQRLGVTLLFPFPQQTVDKFLPSLIPTQIETRYAFVVLLPLSLPAQDRKVRARMRDDTCRVCVCVLCVCVCCVCVCCVCVLCVVCVCVCVGVCMYICVHVLSLSTQDPRPMQDGAV